MSEPLTPAREQEIRAWAQDLSTVPSYAVEEVLAEVDYLRAQLAQQAEWQRLSAIPKRWRKDAVDLRREPRHQVGEVKMSFAAQWVANVMDAFAGELDEAIQSALPGVRVSPSETTD